MAYQDTEADAIRAACEYIEGFEPGEDIKAVPDRSLEFCWMVVNFTNKTAAVVWLRGDDGEIDFAGWDEPEDWPHIIEQFTSHGGEY